MLNIAVSMHSIRTLLRTFATYLWYISLGPWTTVWKRL